MNKPNIIIVLSDDQGYGDFGSSGNPWLNTPNLDDFATKAVRLEDFHTCPMCAPTRAALMSGMYPDRAGVWSTLNGCYIMRTQAPAMPQIFRGAGYRTGMFGKWHLGDNYPYRPQDRGFEKAVTFGGGVIGEVPDYWDNDYFDDRYLTDGHWEEHQGYCTDIWFDQALRFIKDSSDRRPFFCYIANNAPHGPFNVDNRYSDQYEAKGLNSQMARFYGMIENIDENFGKLERALTETGQAENTIVVYFGDNGTSAGAHLDERGFVREGFNAGLRGKKCDPYEGGHKNACFIRWPGGGLEGGYGVGGLSTCFDLLPTLVSLTQSGSAADYGFDGMDLSADLQSPNGVIKDRSLVIHNMQLEIPRKYKDFCVLTNRWRLVKTATYGGGETELYDIGRDPSQRHDLASEHPEVTARLSELYESWWEEMSVQHRQISRIGTGSAREPVTKLTSHSWRGSTKMSYNQTHIRDGIDDCGYWELEVLRAGRYRIELRRWPAESALGLGKSAPEIRGRPFVHDRNAGRVYQITDAGIRCGETELCMFVTEQDQSAEFILDLPDGPVRLEAWFGCADGGRIGAYYAYISPAGRKSPINDETG